MERLRACDRWHPDTPARLATHVRGIVRCKECAKIRSVDRRSVHRRPYGVIRLSWAPPEFAT